MATAPQFAGIIHSIEHQQRQLITGVAGSARTLLLAALQKRLAGPQLVVVDSLFHMEELVNDLTNLLPETAVYAFPAEESLALAQATSSPNYRLARVLAMQALLTKQPALVVAPAAGLLRPLPQPAAFQAAQLSLTVGAELDLTTTATQLAKMGYVRQKMVAAPGDFAIRGSILDIYALNTPYPVRVDLFDTEIDSLRYFEADSQRSLQNIEAATILPATELVMDQAATQRAAAALQAELTKRQAELPAEQQDQLAHAYAPVIEELKAGHVSEKMLGYPAHLYETPAWLGDYLPTSGSWIIDDLARIKEQAKQLVADQAAWQSSHQQPASPTFDLARRLTTQPQAQTYLALFKKGLGGLQFANLVDLHARQMQRFFGQVDLLKSELQRYVAQGETVVILTASEQRRRKVANDLATLGLSVVETAGADLQPHQLQLVAASLNHGFELPPAQLAVITEGELFKQLQKRRVRPPKLSNAERLKSYTDLKPGDFVVHVNHGIGVFAGIKTMQVDGVHQDYIVIDYRDHAQIFVPITQLNLVQKYVAAEGKQPRINRLGGSEWAKTKHRVAAKVEDIADELVDLYAQRQVAKGYAFPADDYLQEKFDQEFPYVETPDQLRSIDEIKADMEAAKPMDRLLVGDVGYGKTEVAMRAVFKAVAGGKQVAFLVPTTILAQQHFDTLTARFEGFPISVALMSRFKTRAELKETEQGLAAGTVDVVIGTHRILSKDVHFKDLGLLIIDEEQRFGVKHKERLKQLKTNVDVLTLTATPIPRTLHMSMLGVRDLSVLETPPNGRYPIQTYVLEQNAGAIQTGIRREMQRGGQVYYLHNRVGDIERVVAELQTLVPEARIGYIHGQMTEVQLEGVLYDFIRGEYDVLVTTSIIETGVDIPNVNTLFVEDADRMGLAQLYQIRGRIGRSNRVAFAYFMYQPNKVLTELGEKRLAAIRDFTELGSGFKIAMRDLSIRGAGSLLGKQQHGFIDSVGYDLYSTMLAEAVAQKQGKAPVKHSDAELELGIEAYFPDAYISDQRQKIEWYKALRNIASPAELTDLTGDLLDRYGDYPAPVATLLQVAELKLRADQAQLAAIRRQKDNLMVELTPVATHQLTPPQIIQALAKTRFKATLGEEAGRLTVRLIIQPKMTTTLWLQQLIQFVAGLQAAMQKTNKDGGNADATR
ncbi:MAG: transcription-repair coupling factor [Limosilactobacillus ingluviei]|nr:transcription-repair coupling factor [Limosilactobacillus ingluviei]